MIEAKEILCSESPSGDRLMTMLGRYPQFIHNEHLRHRAFSFSVSSNRAIPLAKALEEVRSDELRAAPVWWGREQKGMSAGEELAGEYDGTTKVWSGSLSRLEEAKKQWQRAAFSAAEHAEFLQRIGLHKSIASRILSPFLHHNVLWTGTTAGWLNFFGLRLDHAAQAEIRVLAEACWKVWNESRPKRLEPGQWHLPFVEQDDLDNFDAEVCLGENEEVLQGLIKISVARCARLSYLSFETGRRSTIEEDLALYDRLINARPIHASSAEHQATPDIFRDDLLSGEMRYGWERTDEAGNLGPGWRQYRKMLPNEAVAPLPESYQND